MSSINNKLNKINNKNNTITTSYQNTIKQINSKKLINNFTKKYNNNTTSQSRNTFKELITENSAIIILGIITFIFIVLGIYYYFKESSNIKHSKTYYGKKLLSYEPIFKLNTDNINNCIDRCKKDTLCTGITFNTDELQCLGTSKGQLRDDEPNNLVWLKINNTHKKLQFHTLSGFTNSKQIISTNDIPNPQLKHQFTYAFYLYIRDFYENQGNWRHILHKGDDINKLNTPNWEDIVKEIPNQSIGVWLAPFHNNLRIAITTIQNINKDTITYPHANKQEITINNNYNNKPNIYLTDMPHGPYQDNNRASLRIKNNNTQYQKNLEYIDIYNIPIKKLLHITITINEKIMEVYINTKLHKIIELKGYPEFNTGNITLLNPTSLYTDILDLKYIPNTIPYKSIKNLNNNQNKLTQSYQ